MKKRKSKVFISLVIAVIGAILLGFVVKSAHNRLVINNQLENSHEKLELIEEMIEQSKTDEEEITAVYDEQYVSKADTIAFYAKNLADFSYTDSYASELKELFQVDYIAFVRDGNVVAKAGDEISEEEGRSYTSDIDSSTTVEIRQNSEQLEANLQENASLSYVLNDIHVGQNGFAFAVHSEKQTIIFSPVSDDIGEMAGDHDIDISKLVDGTDVEITYDDVEYLCSVKQIDKGLISVAVPLSEIKANEVLTVAISEVIYGIFMSIMILYSTFLNAEVRSNEEEMDVDAKLNKKLGSIVAVGVVLSFVVTWYMQTLFTLSQQSITNNSRVTELLNTLKNNDATVALQEEQYNDQYSEKLNEATYIVQKVDESKLDRAFFTELKDALKVNSVMYFNLDGQVIAANTDNWSYTISTDETQQSYEFWDILNGDKTEIIQDVQENVNGNLRQYMAKAVQDDSYHTIGMITMSATPEALENALINTDRENVLSGISTGNKGFAFAVQYDEENEEYDFYYFPQSHSDLIGEDVTRFGMNEDQIVDDYNDFIVINNTVYYCASSQYDGLYVYIAVPFSALNHTALPVALITTGIMLVCMCVLWFIYSRQEAEAVKVIEKEKENEQVDVTVSNGRTAKARAVGFRWTHRAVQWESKTAGQKTSAVVNNILTLLSLIVLILVAFADQLFADDSLIRFILNGQWQKGINIFSITYCILIIICVNEITLLARRFIMWIAHSLNAKGETICRLIDNFLKFASMIGLLYFTLATLGVDTSTLVTSAGILTLIVGLGAQSLVSDILAGLFIVFESEFQVGDIVTIDGTSGTVVEIGVRTTKISTGGNIKIFSNSSVKNILNMTKDYSSVVCNMSIDYGEDLHYVEKILDEEFPNIKAKLPAIVDGPFYRGVADLADSAVVIKIVAQCKEGDRGQLELDLRRQLKLVFDKHKINIPFPQIVINKPEEAYHQTSNRQKMQAENFVKEQQEEFKDTKIVDQQ